MRKSLLLASMIVYGITTMAQVPSMNLKHLAKEPDMHVLTAILTRQHSNSSPGKTTAVQKRLAASSYKANGMMQDSSRYYYSEGRGSVKNITGDYFYPAPGRIQSIFCDSVIRWQDDPQNGFSWNNTQVYQYDATSQAISGAYSGIYYMYGFNADYDANGKLLKTISLDTIGGTAFIPKSERRYFYNAQNQYVGDSSYSLQTGQPMAKTIQTYDVAGNLTSYDSYTWQNNSWFLGYKTVYAYDNSNRLIERYSQYDFGSGLVNNIRDTFAYNGASTDASYNGYYFWSGQNSNWYPVESFLYQFKGQGLIDTYYIRTMQAGAIWDTTERDVYYYDKDNLVQEIKGFYHATGGVFNPANYDIHTFYYDDYYPQSVHGLEERAQVSIYPNPTRNGLYIKMNKLSATAAISNLSGQKIFTCRIQQDKPIEVSHLVKGVYLLQVTDEGGVPIYTGRFVKE